MRPDRFQNTANAINWKMFELAQTPYMPPHFPYDTVGPTIDCEVLKMVKALQGELSNFWAGLWRGLVQDIKNKEMAGQLLLYQRGGGVLGTIRPLRAFYSPYKALKGFIEALRGVIVPSSPPPTLGTIRAAQP